MSESDILLQIGLDAQPVLDAFESIRKASSNSFNQTAMDAYGKKLSELQGQLAAFESQLKKIGSQGVTTQGFLGINPQEVSNASQSIDRMISSMQRGQQRILESREKLTNTLRQSRGVANAEAFIGFTDADADKAINRMKANNAKIAEAREQQNQRLLNANAQMQIAQERQDDAYNERQRRKFSYTSSEDRAAAQQRMRQIYAPGGEMETARGTGDAAKVRELTSESRALNESLSVQATAWQKNIGLFGQHLLQWGAYAIVLTAAFEILSKIGQAIGDINAKGAEFQVQMVQFQASQKVSNFVSGKNSLNVSNPEMLGASADLAMKYGDSINAVAQDLTLWTKATGDFNSAQALTNEALKFNLATGTQLEDVYRTLTALSSQATDVPFSKGDKHNFNLQDTDRVLHAITAEAYALGAGLDTANKKMGVEGSNAAIYYMQALEQDSAALSKLHYSVEDQIAINAALIKAFGNTGQAAEEAGDRISRIVGGLTKLQLPPAIKQLEKQYGMSQSQVNQMFSSSGDVLGNLSQMFPEIEKTNRQLADYLSFTVGGTRQTQAFAEVLKIYRNDMADARKALKDYNAEDQIATEMMKTEQKQLDVLHASWGQFATVLGVVVVPAVTSLVKSITELLLSLQMLGGQMAALNTVGEWTHAHADLGSYLTPAGRANLSKLDREAADARVQLGAQNAGNVLANPVDIHGRNWNLIHSHNVAFPHEKQRYDYQFMNPQMYDLYKAGKLTPGSPMYIENQEWRMGPGGPGNNFSSSTAGIRGRFPPSAPPDIEGGDLSLPTTAGAGKGLGPDSAKINQITLANAQYNLLNAQIKSNIAVTEASISADEQSAGKKGMTSEVMTSLNKEYTTYLKLLGQQQALDKGEMTHWTKVKDNFANAAAKDKDPRQRARDLSDEADAMNHLATATTTYYADKAKIFDINSKQQNLPYENALYDAGVLTRTNSLAVDQANTAFGSSQNLSVKRDAIMQLAGLYNPQQAADQKVIASLKAQGVPDSDQRIVNLQREQLSLQTDINSKTKEYADEVRNVAKDVGNMFLSLQEKTIKAALPLSGYSKGTQEYMSAQLDIQKENLDYAEKMHQYELEGVPESQLSSIRTLHDNWQNIAESAASYKEKLDQIQSLPAYAAMEGLFKGLSEFVPEISTIGINGPTQIAGGAANQALGITAAQQYLQVLQNQVSALNNEKDILGYIYNSQITHTQEQKEAFDLENLQLQAQIKNIQTIEQMKQEQLSHPSEFTQLAQKFQSSFTDSIASSFQSNFMGLLSGGGGSAQEQFNQAIQQFNSSNGQAAQLTQAIIQYFAPSATQLSRSLGSQGASSGPLSFNADLAGNFSYNATVNAGTGFSSAAGASVFGIAGAAGAYGLTAGLSSAFGGGGASSISASSGNITASGSGSLADQGYQFQTPGFSNSDLSTPTSGPFTAVNTPSTGGGGFSMGGFGQGLGGKYFNGATAMTYMNLAGAAYGLFQDVTKGPGGLQGGIAGAEYGAEIGSLFPGAGTLIGAGVGFLAGLFGGNHDNPANMPDKYDTQRFTLYVGELQGAAGTAYGPNFNPAGDPIIQALGGKSMLQYIQSWIIANLASPDPVKAKLAAQLKPLYGTSGGGLGFDQDIGDEWVKGGTLSGTYVSIYQSAMQAVQEIMQLTADTAQPNQLVALNQYGGASGGFNYSWDIPGYDAPFTPPGQGGGTPPSSGPAGFGAPLGGYSGGSSGGGGNYSPGGGSSPAYVGGGSSSYAYRVPSASPSVINLNTTHNLQSNLDGRTVARSVQSYQYRATAQGYSSISI